jgi:hypothetical protein
LKFVIISDGLYTNKTGIKIETKEKSQNENLDALGPVSVRRE